MSDTPLLPPDPTITAGWWVQCGVSDPILATWDAYDQRWLVPGSVHGSMHRYHLACLRPIPRPAALEAVCALVDTLRDMANDAVIPHQGAHIVGEEAFSAAGARVMALRDAAAMLSAALKTQDTP